MRNFKYFFIFLFLLPISTICFGQNKYIPFIDQNKYWLYNVYQDFESNRVVNSYVIWTGQDSIINGKVFYKLYKSNLDGFPISPTNYNFVPFYPYKFKDKNLSWLITEDTLQKKVYFKFQDSLKLLYDFNLEVGQSLDERLLNIIKPANWPIKDSLGKITALIIENSYNSDRKTFIFNGPEVYGLPFVTDMRLIEGIGIIPYNGFYPSYDIIFDFCEGSLCDITSNTIENYKAKSKQIIIYPNPSSSFIQVETHIDISSVEIIDQNGKVVMISSEQNINIGDLLSGIYIVKCITKKNEVMYEKFVKI